MDMSFGFDTHSTARSNAATLLTLFEKYEDALAQRNAASNRKFRGDKRAGRWERLYIRRVFRLRSEILATPADDAAGIAVKLALSHATRCTLGTGVGDPDYIDEPVCAALHDALRVAGLTLSSGRGYPARQSFCAPYEPRVLSCAEHAAA